MPASTPGDRKPVTPDERLHIASVRPTTSDALGWTGLRAEHLTDPPDTAVELVSRGTYFDGPWITISEGGWTASGGGAPIATSGSATHAL